MNIFYLDEDISKCAEYHCDKHVVKMILETAQLLSTVIHESGITPSFRIYRKTHVNHPSAKWARESSHHFRYLVSLGLSLCSEYTKRYGKIHKTQEILENINSIDISLPDKGFIPPPQAMPDKYRSSDTVKAYRDYYIGDKGHILQYKTRIPDWIKEKIKNV